MKNKATLSIIFILLCFNLFFAKVPDFSLKSINDNEIKFSEYIGKKIIVIDFWATWCKPCKKLLKDLNKIYKELNNEIEVFAISVDNSQAIQSVENYIKARRFKFKVLLDSDRRVNNYFNPSNVIPFTVIINKKGEVSYAHSGYIPGYIKELKSKIKEILEN